MRFSGSSCIDRTSAFVARINDVAKLNRYDLEAFLGIYKDAELLVHPRNEVIFARQKSSTVN